VKELLGTLAVIISIAAFVPYIRSILQGTTKPHVFSWIIWGSTTFIVFLAQFADKGGAGTWSIGISGLITFYVAWLAYQKKSDSSATRSDWFFFTMAMLAIPFWYLTSNPLSAVLLLTAIDIIGYLPTLRKAYAKPFEEQTLLYNVISVRNLIAITALEHYSLATVLFPALTTFANLVLVGIVYARRRRIA
jgi:hypothetical protein